MIENMRRIYEVLGFDTFPLNKPIEVEEIKEYVNFTKEIEDALKHVDSISIAYSLKDDNGKELLVFEFSMRELTKCEQYMKMLTKVFQYSFAIVFITDDKYRLMLDDKYDLYEGERLDSGWIYDEELLDEFIENYFDDEFPLESVSDLNQFYSNYEEFIDAYSSCEYICLRRLIDLLKIRNIVRHDESIEKVINNLFMSGDLEMLNDYIGVVYLGYAETSYSIFGHTYTIKDSRFNEDNFYAQLPSDEFTSMDECMELYKSIVTSHDLSNLPLL